MRKYLEPALMDIIDRIASEFNAVRQVLGSLTNLTTDDKTSFVNAINSLQSHINRLNQLIDDNITSTNKTWSSSKINTLISQIRSDYATNSDVSRLITNLRSEINTEFTNYLKITSQSLTDAQKNQVRDNINAANRTLSDVTSISSEFSTLIRSDLDYKTITDVTVSGDLNKTLKITYSDGSFKSTTFNDINLDPTKINSIEFDASTGILKATNPEGQIIDVPLDGRWVKLDDPRLTDSRPASDVKPWAKGDTKPEYNFTEITNKPDLLKLSNVAQKGNVRLSPNKIEIFDGSNWVSHESSGSSGSTDLIHRLDDTNLTDQVPSGKLFVFVSTTQDTTLTIDNPFLILIKDMDFKLIINTTEIRQGWAYLIGTQVIPSHPYLDLLQIFNDTYDA